MTREQRMALVEWDNPEIPIATQARLLSLNRTSLYYKPVGPSPEEIAKTIRTNRTGGSCQFTVINPVRRFRLKGLDKLGLPAIAYWFALN